MSVPEISSEALAPRIGQVVLIDVRQPDEYEAGHVRTARLIPLHELPDHVGELPVDEEVVVMCRSGSRSEVASEFLIENGVSAFNLVGGILAWVKAGNEVVAADQPRVTSPLPDPPARWVDDDDALRAVVASALEAERYALDTEFHRERSYYPKLALVQLAWEDRLALIDPLATDIRLLVPLFEGSGLAVLHAAQQDLDVLTHACGAVPARLADTQLVAGFIGHSTPSLSSLVSGELQIVLPKSDRLTDWLRRPLSEDQKTYAASDVAHLFALYDGLAAQLEELGRLDWALVECEELRTRPVGPSDPDDAWLRLKDVRTLKRHARGVAKSVAAWRERRAARSDTPVRSVLPDLAVLAIAQRAPHDAHELRGCRGVDERHSRGTLSQEILEAVELGRESPVDLPHRDEEDLDRSLRPAVTLVSAWVSQLAHQQRIDTTLLATRSDLVALLRGDAKARLAEGWRAEVLGDDVKRLVAGDAALSFDGRGGLRLIALD